MLRGVWWCSTGGDGGQGEAAGMGSQSGKSCPGICFELSPEWWERSCGDLRKSFHAKAKASAKTLRLARTRTSFIGFRSPKQVLRLEYSERRGGQSLCFMRSCGDFLPKTQDPVGEFEAGSDLFWFIFQKDHCSDFVWYRGVETGKSFMRLLP